MTGLLACFPGLARFTREPLITAPTPVEPLRALSQEARGQLWIKRDDLSSPEYGGNKFRKLEYLLSDARSRGADLLLTRGSVGSHHVLATVLAARRVALETHALVCGEALTSHTEATLRATLDAGAVLHPVPTLTAGLLEGARLDWHAVRARMCGRRPYVIGLGGTTPLSVLAHIEAAFELAQQVERGEAPWPEDHVVALGSGSSAAGLCIGLVLLERPGRIIAARIGHPFLVNAGQMGRLIHKTEALLRSAEPKLPPFAASALQRLLIDDRVYGPGYAVPTPESTRMQEIAHALESLTLDPTYTAKTLTLACVVARAHGPSRPGLYWHTLSARTPCARDLSAPLPHWVKRLCGPNQASLSGRAKPASCERVKTGQL